MRDAVAARAPLMQRSGAAVERLLDAALLLCEQCVSFLLCLRAASCRACADAVPVGILYRGTMIEPGAIFVLLEQLMEGSTVPDCEAVFSWMERARAALAAPALWARGKLILLRTCNELTRRLSRAAHPVLCGRVLLLLAAAFPLSERSALNMQGAFNRGNVTRWEGAAEASKGLNADDTAEEGELINVEFYDAFWSLQHAFCNMPGVLPPAAWAKFARGAEASRETTVNACT
jgi:hypothetical protein